MANKSAHKFPVALLAGLGLAVLIGDVLGDIGFFSDPTLRTPGLMISAAVRNTLTLGAIVCLFLARKWAAYLLLLAALLGAWRRVSFVAPLGAADWTLIHSGGDLAFRCLILGVAVGYFVAQQDKETE